MCLHVCDTCPYPSVTQPIQITHMHLQINSPTHVYTQINTENRTFDSLVDEAKNRNG